MRRKLILIVSLLVCLGQPVLAVEAPRWEEPMARLDRMVGFWEVRTYARGGNGHWEKGQITLSNISHELGGAVLREDTLVMDTDQRFELVNYWSWDQFEDTYRVAVMDRELGLMDVYEGGGTKEGLVLTRAGGGGVFKAEGEDERMVRLRQEFPGPKRYTLYIEENVGDGWQDFMRIEYRRKPERASPAAEVLMETREFVNGGNML